MSNRRIKGLAVAVALLAITTWILVGYFHRPRPSLDEATEFVRALHKYAESREQRGQPPSASVELLELVEGGFVSARDARWFDGSKVTFTLAANTTHPQEALIRVQLRDGRVMIMSVDGSVSMLPR